MKGMINAELITHANTCIYSGYIPTNHMTEEQIEEYGRYIFIKRGIGGVKMEYEKKLGRIKDFDVFIEDHGILTSYITFDFGGSQQGFGGYGLDEWNEKKDRRVGTASGMDFYLKMLKFFAVDRVSQIKGKVCYALYESPQRWNDPIVGIEKAEFDGGQIFILEDHFEEWYGDEEWFKKQKREKKEEIASRKAKK
jgi:hypothetical protein